MIPLKQNPVTIDAPEWKPWTARVNEAVVGAQIDRATLSRILAMQRELARYINLNPGGVVRASDDDLKALLMLRAYERQCRDQGVTLDQPPTFPTPADLLNIILS